MLSCEQMYKSATQQGFDSSNAVWPIKNTTLNFALINKCKVACGCWLFNWTYKCSALRTGMKQVTQQRLIAAIKQSSK